MLLNKPLFEEDFRLKENSVSERLDILEEMANFKKSETGLPVNIWLDTGKTYLRSGHDKRLKFQGDYGNNMNWSNFFSMTISKDNPEIPSDQVPKVKLPAKDIEKIRMFIKVNYSLLDKLADEKITISMFLKQMKKSN